MVNVKTVCNMHNQNGFFFLFTQNKQLNNQHRQYIYIIAIVKYHNSRILKFNWIKFNYPSIRFIQNT